MVKGAYSALCTPDGEVHFNSTGNSSMAKGGSGDVLSGIIASLLAQNYSPLNAARIGAYVHGRAGDLALQDYSPFSVIASDLIENIGKAFLQLMERREDKKT
jgi:NAD(P)H-hydrate epimerase